MQFKSIHYKSADSDSEDLGRGQESASPSSQEMLIVFPHRFEWQTFLSTHYFVMYMSFEYTINTHCTILNSADKIHHWRKFYRTSVVKILEYVGNYPSCPICQKSPTMTQLHFQTEHPPFIKLFWNSSLFVQCISFYHAIQSCIRVETKFREQSSTEGRC